MMDLILREQRFGARIGEPMMIELSRQILLQLLAARRADASQGVVALKGVRQFVAHEPRQPALRPLDNGQGSDLRTRADQELARALLTELVLQDADAVRLALLLQFLQPIISRRQLPPEYRPRPIE